MIYLFDDNASDNILNIRGENYKYLVKVLRHSVGDILYFRNENNIETLYKYEIISIKPRELELKLISKDLVVVKSKKSLHIAWCVIDPKSIEKVLPSLNEIGVSKISFIYCDRSQKNFKLDFKRFYRILKSSMQQCGRTEFMEFDTYKNIEEFILKYPDTKVLDFTDKILSDTTDFNRVLVGAEGGFSKTERKLLSSLDMFRLDTPMVLRSESACVAIASKVLF